MRAVMRQRDQGAVEPSRAPAPSTVTLLGSIGFLAAVAMLVAAALTTATARAVVVLYDQTANAGSDGVPSQEFPESPSMTSQAADDFTVPYGQHWAISEVGTVGSSASTANRPFNLWLYGEQGPRLGPGKELFAARNLNAVGGPSYSIPVVGAPVLDPGTYWVSAQASNDAGGTWLWSPQRLQGGRRPAIWQNVGNGLGTDCIEWWTRDSCLALPEGEPDQAFRLIGTHKQVLRTGYYGNTGRIVSSPPGIDCPGTCAAAFDRGAVVTLTGIPLRPNMEFTGWRRGVSLPPAEAPPPAPAPTDLPCPGVGDGPCQLALNEDITIYGTYQLSNRIQLGKLKRDLGEGTAKLFVRLPAAGALSLTGNAIKPFREAEAKPGLLRLPLIPKGAAKRRLARTGSTKVSARIKFRSSGNLARTVVKRLTLRQRL